MDIDDRVRDELPVNAPYDGLVAQAYDVWLPPGGRYDDVDFYRHLVERGRGPALELGCGNGRLLIGYVEGGLTVEGVDAAADMLALCRAHAHERGIDVTLHHADWVVLDLGRRYSTVYNPAGSFALVDDVDHARDALRSWAAHVEGGGRLYVSMGVPRDDLGTEYGWRVRRSGTRASDGVTFMVHEAVRHDPEQQITHALNRHEVWDADGALLTTFVRRHRLRWWEREQLEAVFRDAGLVDVGSGGSPDAFVTHGTRPG